MLFVPILMILLLVASGTPGQIQAREKDHFACWTSGPLSKGDHKWGDKDDEFVVDQRDLGDVARFNMKLYPEVLEGVHHRDKSELLEGVAYEKLSKTEKLELTESLDVYTLFDSLPELVDYVFALDVFYTGNSPYSDRGIHDRRVKMLAAAIAGLADYELTSAEDHRMLLSWQDKDPPEDPAEAKDHTKAKKEYLERRTIGAHYEGVKSLSTEWIDPANPGGGRAVDSVALAKDQAATDMELVEGTITTAEDGGRVQFGTTEGIGQQVIFQNPHLTTNGTRAREMTPEEFEGSIS